MTKTTYPSGTTRGLVIGLVCSLILTPALANFGESGKPGFLVELPEITTALDHEYQVSLQLALRPSGPVTEKQARDNLIRLRHTLVMELADRRPGDLDAQGIENLIESFRGEANAVLGTRNGIRSVLVTKFVIQGK